MSVAVYITVEPSDEETVGLYIAGGNNKRRQLVKTFSKSDTTWVGHVSDAKDVILQAEKVEVPVKVRDNANTE